MSIKIAPKIRKATVTFTTQAREGASHAILKGEWDGWTAREMKKNRDGSFSVAVNIYTGKSYQFGYSIDENWTTDTDLPQVASPFGTNNSIIYLPKTADTRKSASRKKPVVKRKTGRRSVKV